MHDLLFITNPENDAREEDAFLANCLSHDWNVTMVNPEKALTLMPKVNRCIIRNACPSRQFEVPFSKLEHLAHAGLVQTYNPMAKRVRGFAENKHYLCTLFQDGFPVIPTWLQPTEMRNAGYPETTSIIQKPLNGCSSWGLVETTLGKAIVGDSVIQPKLVFQDELSFFFIDNNFAYALVSAGPGAANRWNLTEFTCSTEYLAWATQFVKWNNLPFGIQRIDAGRDNNGKLWLMEVEDTMPYLSLPEISEATRNRVSEMLRQSVKANLGSV